MTERSNPTADSAENEFVLTRVFDAPRVTVWKAFTEPERLEQWWGPRGFNTRVHKLELRADGVFYTHNEHPTAARCLANGSIAKSSLRSGLSSSFLFAMRMKTRSGIH
jgi:uncharacterized protein YndB with AHSA1/START domain